MSLADVVGVTLVVTVGTLTALDPDPGEAIMRFYLVLVGSQRLFIPALATAPARAPPVYGNLTRVVLLGSLILGALVAPLDMRLGEAIAAGEGVSFCMSFLLARNDNPARHIEQG
ncbi:MAG: hypothetical protein RIB52_04345 [Erythrobacter sp.]|uniref:hypothetical protein n=1 Tax=Erythrobacter sp. TaxID=1042 RepID=UPI0032EFBEA7